MPRISMTTTRTRASVPERVESRWTAESQPPESRPGGAGSEG